MEEKNMYKSNADRKIGIIKILIVIFLILIIFVAVILLFFNNFIVKSDSIEFNSIEKANIVESNSEKEKEKKEYKPYAVSEQEKVRRGYELFGSKNCRLSEYIVQKLREEEWNQNSDYKDEEHNIDLVNADIMEHHCGICGNVCIGPSDMRYKLCGECAKLTNRCQNCGKLKLEEEKDKLSLEYLQRKENILEISEEYIQPSSPEATGGKLINNYIYITEDYYIYNFSDDELRYYKKLDEETAKSIINDIYKLNDKRTIGMYTLKTKDLLTIVDGEEIGKILKEYKIYIDL